MVLPQEDPNKAVTRSSFVASVSGVILAHYQQYVKEDCSLRLISSDTSISEVDAQSTRRGLERLFDALDVVGSRRLSGSVLIAMLGLLSQGTLDDRLYYMITVSGKAIGDVVNVSSLTPVIEGLFLFLDMLMPTAIYAFQVVVASSWHLGYASLHSTRADHQVAGPSRAGSGGDFGRSGATPRAVPVHQ